MGTKNNPGDYDCYENAHDDEPMFVLLAKDSNAPDLVDTWAELYLLKGGSRDKAQEAFDCANAMRKWKAENPDI